MVVVMVMVMMAVMMVMMVMLGDAVGGSRRGGTIGRLRAEQRLLSSVDGLLLAFGPTAVVVLLPVARAVVVPLLLPDGHRGLQLVYQPLARLECMLAMWR